MQTAIHRFRSPTVAGLALSIVAALAAAPAASACSFSVSIQVGTNPAALIGLVPPAAAQFQALSRSYASSGASRKMTFSAYIARNGVRDPKRAAQFTALYASLSTNAARR
ncbi:MAG: hypothetical protein U0575_12835 [Phycisphaerales bacterium]